MRHLSLTLLILAIGAGCHRVPEQEEVEAQTLVALNEFYRMHIWEKPTIVVTNLEDLYLSLNRAYPHTWHAQFMRYGRYAGFSNSFFEKYVFFHPGSTSEVTHSELVFMNAKPFPRFDGKLGRYALIKVGDQYEMRRLSEDEAQLILRDNRIKPFPSGAISPPPGGPPEPDIAFHLRVQDKFIRACYKAGLAVEATGHLWRVVVFSPVLLLGLLGLWFWRSRQRKSGHDRA